MTEKIDTVIVGGGQGGLSTSYFLSQQGREHIILEQTLQAAKAWRERWDSFTFNTPNWMTQLPGVEYEGNEPDGFLARDEIIRYFEEYIKRNKLPVRYGIQVKAIMKTADGYLVETDKTDYMAANVVVATGLFQHPKDLPFRKDLSAEIVQLHSSEYRNPGALPEGAVLVVGSAQSGCQIAEELYQNGRKVYMALGNAGRFPRRYRGMEATRWLDKIGFFDKTPDMLPSSKARFAGSPHLTGKDGGHTINLHQFARDGVTLLGHIKNARGYRITLVPDLKDCLAKGDQFEAEMVRQIDDYINRQGLDVPLETLPELRNGYESEEILELDLQEAGISSIVWATGFSFDFSLVKLPIFDEFGFPVQKRGVTEYPGLYFVGIPFLYSFKSGILYGVGEDAAYVAKHISSRVLQTN